MLIHVCSSAEKHELNIGVYNTKGTSFGQISIIP